MFVPEGTVRDKDTDRDENAQILAVFVKIALQRFYNAQRRQTGTYRGPVSAGVEAATTVEPEV